MLYLSVTRYAERFARGAGPFRSEQNVVGTDDRRDRARHTVRRVVSHAADRSSDGQSGRRRPDDVPVVRGRGRGRRAVHETRRRPKAVFVRQGPQETRRSDARAERHRSTGGQVGGHSRWQAASRKSGRVIDDES